MTPPKPASPCEHCWHTYGFQKSNDGGKHGKLARWIPLKDDFGTDRCCWCGRSGQAEPAQKPVSSCPKTIACCFCDFECDTEFEMSKHRCKVAPLEKPAESCPTCEGTDPHCRWGKAETQVPITNDNSGIGNKETQDVEALSPEKIVHRIFNQCGDHRYSSGYDFEVMTDLIVGAIERERRISDSFENLYDCEKVKSADLEQKLAQAENEIKEWRSADQELQAKYKRLVKIIHPADDLLNPFGCGVSEECENIAIGLVAKLAQAREDLIKHGAHHHTCKNTTNYPCECTCGFDLAKEKSNG